MASIKHLVDLDLSKNQLLNAVVQNLAAAPASPLEGQIYWSTADDTLYVYDLQNTAWIDLGASGVTNLAYTASASNGIVTSNTGSNATIPLTGATNAGLFSAAQKTKLDGIQAGAQADQNASEVPSSASGNLSSTNVQSALQELQGDIDSLGSATNNLGITHNASDVDITIQNGSDITLNAATTSVSGAMTAADKTKLNGIATGAQVNVAETVTSISIASNIVTYTDENGTDTDIDLSLYLDDSNLSRITSGSINGSTGVATFTRSDSSTFTIDMSDFLDAITLNNTLTSTSTTEGLTANMGKSLKDLIDIILGAMSGTNTGDEPDSSTTVKGIIETATQTEVNNGTAGIRAVIPSTLRSTLGITATLATTLTYTQLVGGSTSQVITHAIGNQFVQVQVFEVAGMDKVECEVELTSATTTTLKFNTAPAANSLRVVIIG
tara:strand:- start:1451 stop:2767 length:1317 start_codon:yes stop_codon:yes gene_type:complete